MTYFKNKSRPVLVSYYFSVYLLRRRAHQNRVDPSNVDTDDEELETVGSEINMSAESILCPPKVHLKFTATFWSTLKKLGPNFEVYKVYGCKWKRGIGWGLWRLHVFWYIFWNLLLFLLYHVFNSLSLCIYLWLLTSSLQIDEVECMLYKWP